MEQGVNKEKQPKATNGNGDALNVMETEIAEGETLVPAENNNGMTEEEKQDLKEKNPNVVDWDGPNDPGHPHNWPKGKKWRAMSVVGLMCFVSPFASTLPAPALPELAKQFGITDSTVAALCVSIFVLAYAIGPLVASPASELYGRTPIYIVCFVIFFAFNIGSALATNTTQFIVCRFFAGLGGSAPLTVAAGSSVDLFTSAERGKSMAIVSMGPLIGPIIGPVIGGVMAERLSVTWALWVLAILSGVVLIFGFFFLKETNAQVLLKQRVSKMREETGNEKLITIDEAAYGTKSPREIFMVNMSRAAVLFFTNPSCMIIGLYMAIAYGYLYLLFVTFGTVFQHGYGQSVAIAGLHYLAPGLGNLIGSVFAAVTIDRVYLYYTKRNNGVGKPEFRVPLMLLSSFLMPAGLFIYGWCAEYHTHWIFLDIGVFIFGFGILMSFLSLNTYLMDAFKYAASAIAATTVIRSIAGAFFPLFGQAMFDRLGLGWGNSLLGFIAIVTGTAYPIFLWYYGPAIRAKGKADR